MKRRLANPSTTDRPFGCPADVTLELPFPPSVNRTRKIDWKGNKTLQAWKKTADGLVTLYKRNFGVKNKPIKGPFEAIITLSEHHGHNDADNSAKHLIDYARRLELIVDDSPKYLRRVVIEWGVAPEGCTLLLRPMEQGG